MRFAFLVAVPCLGFLCLIGCVGQATDQGWQPARPLGSDMATYRPPLEGGPLDQPPAPAEPEGPLTLRQALALSLLCSPELASAAYDVRIGEARRWQASLPPNPEIGFDLETLGTLRAAESVLLLSQVVLLGGKLGKQEAVAALDRDLAGWDYEAKRVALFTETTKAFVTVVAAQERQALVEELVSISEKALQTVSERVRAGKASPLEEMKARLELSAVRLQREPARQELEAARRLLAALWGSARPRFTRATGDLAPPASIPQMDALIALLQQNPDVARWAAEMEQRRAVMRLEKARAWPDLTLGGGYKRDGEAEGRRHGWSGGLSIPLPVFDRNQGGILEAQYGLAQAPQQRRAAEIAAFRDLTEAYQVLASAFAAARILQSEIFPEAQKAFVASNVGYQEGKFVYLDVLDAQRTLFEARLQYIEALADFYRAAANVEGLIGQSLNAVPSKAKED